MDRPPSPSKKYRRRRKKSAHAGTPPGHAAQAAGDSVTLAQRDHQVIEPDEWEDDDEMQEEAGIFLAKDTVKLAARPAPTPLYRKASRCLLRATVAPLVSLLPYLLLALVLYLSILTLRTKLYSILPRFPSHLLPRTNLSSVLHLPSRALTPLVGMYCSTVGVGCVKPKRPLGGVARSVKVQAMQAMDLFQSVLALGGPDGVGTNLHHVALWELAVAVEHTSGLEDRDFLGKQLHVLGDMTRDVKDEVIRLNSQGISSFTWIVHEFTRIEDLLARPQPPSEDFLQNSLTKLYQKISSDLTLLLSSLDRALPLADRASALGGRVGSALAIEYSRVQREKEEIPVWRGLVERNSWKGKQLRRDLELAGGSVEWVKDVRRDLEDTRSGFVEYAANVGHFKAGVVGYHLSGHGLSTEEEVDSLKGVMSEFRAVLEEVKQNSRAGRGRESKREIDADAA